MFPFFNCESITAELPPKPILLYSLTTTDAFDFSINSAAKWHNLYNRGFKPMVNYNLNVTAMKRLNIRLLYLVHYSTSPGLSEGFPVFTVGCLFKLNPSGVNTINLIKKSNYAYIKFIISFLRIFLLS
jgi:hypothetical protein